MAKIFSLFGEILIDNEKANTAIDQTTKKGQDSEKSFLSSFGSMMKGAAKVGAAVVGTAATVVTGLTAYATKVASTADSIDKASQKVGMSAEEYQKWQYAAGLCGIESSKLDGIIKKQQAQFTSAKEGNAGLAKTYKQLGLDIKSISSADEAFDGVIAALADMEDETKRNAIANSLFGKSYTELAPMLNSGSTVHAEMNQECEDLGGVMSQDDVSAGASLCDMVSRVQTAFGGIVNSIGASLFPVVEDLLGLIVENMPAVSSLIKSIAPVLTELLSSILPPFIRLTETIMPILIDLINQLLPFVSEVIEAILPVIVELMEMLLPPILQLVELLLPLLISLIEPLLPLLQPILQLLQPFIDLLMAILVPLIDLLNKVLPPIIDLLTTVINVVLPPLRAGLELLSNVISSKVKGAFDTITPIIEGFKKILNGIISFITGVFSGNWKKAWEGVKTIFSGVFDTLSGIFKAPLNLIIDGINTFIKGLNKLKIPDWVPVVGGKSLNLKTFNKLRMGIDYVPYDEYPTLLHKGERVLTASENKEFEKTVNSNQNQTVINNYNVNVEKVEVREKADINRIAEELFYLLKKKEA